MDDEVVMELAEYVKDLNNGFLLVDEDDFIIEFVKKNGELKVVIDFA